ncbi:hypothetical protein ElyMa_001436700 [Elysia marginata]|uniref:Ig-like domain-containing protein n=1 Tax=Elysia marginata TaxID=1093978 RepID=A0AAV4IY72_9GAST|nr:hypothetical protein ElyMa_001436700 [Elysia marginata]
MVRSHTIVREGGYLDAFCVVEFGKDAQIYFSLKSQTTSKSREVTKWESSGQSLEYVLVRGECVAFATARTPVRISHKLKRPSLACCAEFRSGYNTCCKGKPIPKSYLPRRASIQVTYSEPSHSPLVVGPDRHVLVTCLAPAGYSDYELTWVLKTRLETSKWVVSRHGKLWQLPGSRSHPRLIIWNISHERVRVDRGPMLMSNFTLPVTRDLEDAVLFCATSPLSKSHAKSNIVKELSSERKRLALHFTPEPPRLSIRYDEEPNIVFNDTVLLVNCTARVGTNGCLVWLLDQHAPGRRHRQSWIVKLAQEITDNIDSGVTVSASTVVFCLSKKC